MLDGQPVPETTRETLGVGGWRICGSHLYLIAVVVTVPVITSLLGGLKLMFQLSILGPAYAVYLFECYWSAHRSYLKNMISDPEYLAKYITDSHAFVPALSLLVECSHDETREKVEYVPNGDGKYEPRTVEYTVSVTTHSSSHPCTFSNCEDWSDLKGMTLDQVRKVELQWFEGRHKLLDIDSKWDIESSDGSLQRVKDHLHETHKHLDKSCAVSLTGHKPEFFKAQQSLKFHNKSKLISARAYWFFSMLLLTIPYRLYFNSRARGTLKLSFVKKIQNVQLKTAAQEAILNDV